jgi:hypothetical protein
MTRRRDLPDGWRQPPETTVEPVPMRRPYLATPGAEPRPQPRFIPRPHFTPRSRLNGGGRDRVPWRRASATPTAPTAPTVPSPRPSRLPAIRRWRPMHAVIGDEIRTPTLWCEFGRCIERYPHAEASGERDLRGRALAAGWRYDALGRLACPSCVQCDASFWATRPPVLFNRDR